MMEIHENRTIQADQQFATLNKSGIDSMLSTPATLYIDTVGVAVGGEDGRGQEDIRAQQVRYDKGKDKVFEEGTCSNVEKEPPDKSIFNMLQQINAKTNNKNQSITGISHIDHQRDVNFDEYREPDSEDEDDVDTHSLGEGMEPGEEINTSDQFQKEPLLQSSNIDEIREVTGKQGLSPRGRKIVKQNKLTSTSKPNTRARSRGN